MISDILGKVLQERIRQDAKWGVQDHHLLYWLGILGEEYGEVSKAIIENKSIDDVTEELVQVAAVAIAMLECIERTQLLYPMEMPGKIGHE